MASSSDKKKLKKIVRGLMVGLAAGALALILHFSGLLKSWENTTWDWRVRFGAKPAESTGQIRLVLLDQKSLDWGKETMGLSWPWPRELYSALAAFLNRGQAKAVGLDVLYTEHSYKGVADDEIFFSSLAAEVPFVGALALSRKNEGLGEFPPDLPGIPLKGEGLDRLADLPDLKFKGLTLPVPGFSQACRRLANVTDNPDSDAVFRRVGLVGLLKGQAAPSLGLGTWLAAHKKEDISYRDHIITIGDRKVPLTRDGRTILNYRGGLEVYRPVSLMAIIRSEILLQSGEVPSVDPESFRNCYVMFGFSAPGLKDLRATPISPVAPGVMVHATVLDNLLAGDFISPLSSGALVFWVLLLAVLAGLAMIFSSRAWVSVVVALICIPVPLAAGFLGYFALYWVPIIPPVLGVVFSLAGALVINYATEGRQKAYIKHAFRHYLSPAVIEQLLADPSQLLLGGVRRELSIFFSDLQGFSSFSEKLSPPELTSLLNAYLTDMTDIILEEGGTLDKYEGDAIIAFWNAPLDQPDHALRAVRTAIRCQKKLASRRDELEKIYGARLLMRIGINTGEVVVGNMGSRERFDYTVLGDAANLASRLEGANKAFNSYTMISQATREAAGESVPVRELGQIRVVGKAIPIRVYEPRGMPGEKIEPWVEEFQRGLELCREKSWEAAAAIFSKLDKDPAAAVYLAQIKKLIGAKLEDWDGIWNLSSK